jgi:hypothetical protein
MKRAFALVTIAAVSWTGFMASVHAQIANPNGFPSGPHYNLNIHGKKDGFTCPAVEYDASGNPIYGNSVFIPESGEAQIIMVSGRKGKDATAGFTDLQAVDDCAFDDGQVRIQLPPNEKGYRVFARALAKPIDGSSWQMNYSGELFSAIDEYGNDLVDLGLVTGNVVTPTGQPIVRAKGKSIALDITGLFMWTGTICTIDSSTPYLLSDPSLADYKPLCWIDDDGIPGFTGSDSFSEPVSDGVGGFTCSAGTLIWVRVSCTEYLEPYWIFNIADLVLSDWVVDNNGTKLVQIRFYPVQ